MIICGVSREKYYKNDAVLRYGEDSVDNMLKRQSMIEDGHYDKIGRAIVNMNTVDGSEGYVDFSNYISDNQLLQDKDVYDEIVIMEKLQGEQVKSGEPVSYGASDYSVIVSKETWEGFSKFFIHFWYSTTCRKKLKLHIRILFF